MPSPSEIFERLIDQDGFYALFEARLKLLNAAYGVHLAPGIELDYIHAQWVEMLAKERASLACDVVQIFAQNILGELCHGLARFDSILRAGNHQSMPVGEEILRIRDCINQFPRGFVAVDFCASMYMEIMPFQEDAYRIELDKMLLVCSGIDVNPLQGRDFVKLLQYPDKLKLVH